MSYITVIKTSKPATVGKTYFKRDGVLKKRTIGNVSEGIAATHHIATAIEMAMVLEDTTAENTLVICPGVFKSADGEATSFNLVSEARLKEMLNIPEDRRGPAGVQLIDGRRYAARLKEGISLSEWVLFDADNPPGMPPEWAAMTIGERLTLWEAMLPGVSSCERIELRGSSNRVMNGAGEPPASHAWLRVSDASKIPVMKAHIFVEMVLKDLSFTFSKHSSKDCEVVTGLEQRSLFDLAVFDAGRLVFCSKPSLGAGMEGYSVVDAGIVIVNEGGGVLDLSGISLPKAAKLGAYQKKTKVKVTMKAENGAVKTDCYGMLKPDTPITAKGVTKPFSAWVKTIKPGEKMRCEAPFRESVSEAAFVRMDGNGIGFVFDIGNGTNYWLNDTDTAQAQQPQNAHPEASGLVTDKAGIPLPHLDNLRKILTGKGYAGKVWNDTFLVDTLTTFGGASPVPLADTHILTLQAQLINQYNFKMLSKNTVADALDLCGALYQRNCAREWLNELEWDGTARLEHFFHDGCGVDFTEYTKGASKYLFMSMVARVLNPGCKIDMMIVMEGEQGWGKSSMAKLIGGDWFAEISQDPRDKDFYMVMRGKMLLEMGELASMARAEQSAMKMAITTATDYYRSPYQRKPETHPRQGVFIGTTNDYEWQKDTTGGRRFLPVRMKTAFDLGYAAANRDQLFAEAVHLYKTGPGGWWDVPDAKTAQDASRPVDLWESAVLDYLKNKTEVPLNDILSEFGLEVRDQTHLHSRRLSAILKHNGWVNFRVTSGKDMGRWKWRKQN